MWQKLVIGVVAFKVMFSVVNSQNTINEDVPSLPFCPNKNGSVGTVLVSTLDGKLSALNSSGYLRWQIETGPDPLLVSNIHKLELTNNGEWIRIIPSLTGTLYKFDGNTIDPISISADKLLKSSFKYSDDLVIAGGIEVRTYGVGLHSGQLLYECNQRKCSNHQKNEMDDILVVERTVQTIRAVEPRTGHERWNFSVGLHNVKLPQISCIDTNLFDSNISAIIPEGLLTVTSKRNHLLEESQQHWQYKFHSPIVRVWKWDGLKLNEINLFEPKNMPGLLTSTEILPSIYIGMYQKQLYIHESLDMQTLLNGHHYHSDLIPAESHSIAKIPWKPIAASSQSTEDDSTALSVLNNSEYVNGNGYYLYTEQDIDNHNNAHCKKQSNRTRKIIESILNDDEVIHSGLLSYFTYYGNYYKEIFLMMITAILSPFLIRLWNKKNVVNNNNNNNKEIIIIEKPIEVEIVRPSVDEEQSSLIDVNNKEQYSTEKFTSRFMNEYKLIQCLGKGGFGVVFQVKQIIDDCDYAIKRIPLPNEKKSRDRVMREVKALAKLDHKNIIRYFYSWVEHPPLGWQEEHDKNWVDPSDSELNLTTPYSITSNTNKSLMIKRQKSYSVSIDIPLSSSERREPSFDADLIDNNISSDSEDSLIVFENDANEDSCVIFLDDDNNTDVDNTNNDSKITTTQDEEVSLSTAQHSKRKSIWKRTQRKHHSLDLTRNNLIINRKPPPMYLYIQMQLCKKESLKEWLQVHKTRDYKEMLNIFVQILDAVEYVHLRKLIHRDLKPGNIFFSLDGQIKVADFGLVKDIESSIDFDQSKRNFINNKISHSRGRHTKEVGTTLYMSPEQSNGRNYDYKVDIYSLGIILFELLVPFGTNMERIKILTDIKEKKFPIDFETNYPSEFNLLQNMLDKNPDKRLTTFGIRARQPFNNNNNNNNKNSINSKFEDQHFRLQ